MDLDDIDPDDEGWIWLPAEKRAELQREKNALMRDLLDRLVCA